MRHYFFMMLPSNWEIERTQSHENVNSGVWLLGCAQWGGHSSEGPFGHFSSYGQEPFGHHLHWMCLYLCPRPWAFKSPGGIFWSCCCRICMWVSLLAFCILITQVMLSITGHMIPEGVVVSPSLWVPRIFIFSLLTPFLKVCKTWSPVTVWPQVTRHLMCTWGHPWLDVSSFHPIVGRRPKTWRCHVVP